jgi:hypothetical protein
MAPRAFYRAKRKGRRSKSSNIGGGIMSQLIGGAIYGAVKAPLDNYVTSKVSNVISPMVGQYADNVASIGVLMGIKKFFKNKYAQQAANTGLAIEGAKIGVQLSSGLMGAVGQSNNTITSTQYL